MITLSMIVKNEEKHLRGCLESVKNIADEIVIADTGSSDATLDIAKEFGAKIFHFPWINDFAAARNFSLEKSTCDWILYLDADERLSQSSAPELKKLTKNPPVKNAAFQCSVRNIDEFNNRPSTMLYTRLFPNNPKVRFEGAIHEQIEKSLTANGYTILKSKIEIIHTGYNTSREQLKQKAERNLDILLKEYQARKESYTAFHIAQSYAMLEKKNEAVTFFILSLDDRNLKKEYRALAFRYLAIENAEKHNWADALKNINSSLQCDSNQPLALLAAGKIYAKTGHSAEAEKCCLKAYEVNSQLIKGTLSSYQSIYLDQKDLLYHCMSIALSVSNLNLFSRFFDKFRSLFKNVSVLELELFEALINKNDISEDYRAKVLASVNPGNSELITALLESYPDNRFKLDLLKTLNEILPRNSSILNKLGLYLASLNKFNEAEQYFLRSYEYNADDPSTVFYLVSVFLQNNKSAQIPSLISSAETAFRDIPEVTARLNILKQKLNIK